VRKGKRGGVLNLRVQRIEQMEWPALSACALADRAHDEMYGGHHANRGKYIGEELLRRADGALGLTEAVKDLHGSLD
jgi:hypothetical protein